MKPLFFAALVSALLLTAACSSGSDAGGNSTATPKPGVITVKMFDNSFKPPDMTVVAGTTVTFKLPNVGVLPHNMHIASERGVYRESPWMSPTINGGQTTELVWEVPGQPGTYKFRCDVHEVEMVGTLTVE